MLKSKRWRLIFLGYKGSGGYKKIRVRFKRQLPLSRTGWGRSQSKRLTPALREISDRVARFFEWKRSGRRLQMKCLVVKQGW